MKMNLFGCVLTGLAFSVCLGSVQAQATYAPPRTPDGRPDLQGVWTNASLTPLERPRSVKGPVISEEQALRAEGQRARMMAAQNSATNPAEGAPRAGQDVGGYNAFWIDPGTTYGLVKGERRTSWIVEPQDGRIPYSETGRKTYDGY